MSSKDTPSHILKDADASKSDISVEPGDGGRKEAKQKNKKGKSKGRMVAKAESQVVDTDDELHEYQQHVAQVAGERTLRKTRAKTEDKNAASQNITLNNDVGKKKKKKLKSVARESEERCVNLLI